jgi:hypothetical protein
MMAILGNNSFGRINQNILKPVKQEKVEENVEEIIVPERQIEEPVQIQNSGAPLDYLDRMRNLRSQEKKPIGNQLQSDAKAFEPKE